MNVEGLPSPCYVCDEARLRQNVRKLDAVQARTQCRILLALKGFAMFSVFPALRGALAGICASSLDEARLGYEEFGGEVHVFAPAYKAEEFDETLAYADHLVFNSFGQWRRFRGAVRAYHEMTGEKVECGIRINPEHREVEVAKYDPCQPYSRLGVTRANFEESELDGISGLHFHTLCETNADALARTLDAVEQQFGRFLGRMDWVNFGGGHHITRPDYDADLLCELIRRVQDRYGVQVYLEPGEAVALNAGMLVATVLDVVNNGMDIAILDTSASAHMPDVLVMPYRPEVEGAGQPGDFAHTYRLTGNTCLAGDIIGDYSFPERLEPGKRIVFQDMAHYTMVKNTTFNGIRLPSIAVHDPDNDVTRIVREFTYEDYKNRLS